MGFGQDFLSEMTDSAQWNKKTAQDGYGKRSFTHQGTYPCRYVTKNRKIRKPTGQEVISTAQLWMIPSLTSGEPFPRVQPDDQIVLSDGRTPQIANVVTYEDEQSDQTGPTHTVVFFL